jgi:ankyrin repeat protein
MRSWIVAIVAAVIATNSFGQSEPVERDSSKSAVALPDLVEHRDWEFAERLLGVDASCVHHTQPDGMTALHWAAFHGHAPTIRRLLAAGSDANAITRYGITPLVLACMQGDAKSVELLLSAAAQPSLTIPGGETPLMIAARQGNPAVVGLLLDQKVDIDAGEDHGQTALMWAAAEGNLECVRLLIAAGADLDRTLQSGFNALMFAAREGRTEVVRCLLDAGVDVNAAMRVRSGIGRAARQGMSPLLLAVESGHFELAIALVEWGADPNDQRSGFAPLHALTWVRRANSGDGIDGDPPPRGSDNLSSLDFIRRIVAAGADVNLQLRNTANPGKAKLKPLGATPFLMAAKTADLPMMKTLLELGADPMLSNADECTPILAAAGVGTTAVNEEPGTEREVIEAVEFLLGLCANLHHVDRNGETVMHGAAYRAYPHVVDLLVRRGCRHENWDHANRHGWTPMKIAQGSRPGSVKPSPEVIAALKRAGAE